MEDIINQRLLNNLAACRNVLGGKDVTGNKVSSSMFDKEVISFSHGEGIRRPHPLVILAGVEALRNFETSSLDNYLFLQTYEELDHAIRSDFKKNGIPESHYENICVDAGVTRLIQSFLSSCSSRGDIYLTGPSFYHPLPVWCEHFGVRLEVVPTQQKNNYRITGDDLEIWVDRNRDLLKKQRLKGLFLFNPTMTGTVYTRQDLQDIVPVINKFHLHVFEDAIFMGTEFRPNEASHLLSVPDCSDTVVLATGASKKYSLANLRIGWACGPDAIIKNMNQYSIATSASIPQISKFMASAALTIPSAYYTANTNECIKRLEIIRSCIHEINEEIAHLYPSSQPAIRVDHLPEAGHSVLLNFDSIAGFKLQSGKTISNSVDITRLFLEEAGVSLSPALSNGFPGCRNRISFACVGLEDTYVEAEAWERKYIRDFIIFNQREIKPELECFSHSNRGWEKGKEKIRKALLTGVLTALKNLYHYNKKALYSIERYTL